MCSCVWYKVACIYTASSCTNLLFIYFLWWNSLNQKLISRQANDVQIWSIFHEFDFILGFSPIIWMCMCVFWGVCGRISNTFPYFLKAANRISNCFWETIKGFKAFRLFFIWIERGQSVEFCHFFIFLISSKTIKSICVIFEIWSIANIFLHFGDRNVPSSGRYCAVWVRLGWSTLINFVHSKPNRRTLKILNFYT